MNYPNGQTVSDVKKATSNFSSDAKKIGSDLKSDAKSVASKVEKSADSAISQGSSVADTVMAKVSSFLPVKNTEEAIKMLESTAKDVRSNLETARESAASFIKKYPFYSLLGAGLIGAAAVMLLTPRAVRSPSTDLH